MVIIFTISHGQSKIGKGFSINKEVTIENLESKLLCSQFKCSNMTPESVERKMRMILK